MISFGNSNDTLRLTQIKNCMVVRFRVKMSEFNRHPVTSWLPKTITIHSHSSKAPHFAHLGDHNLWITFRSWQSELNDHFCVLVSEQLSTHSCLGRITIATNSQMCLLKAPPSLVHRLSGCSVRPCALADSFRWNEFVCRSWIKNCARNSVGGWWVRWSQTEIQRGIERERVRQAVRQ